MGCGCECRQVKLVVAKCWDASPRGYFLPPRGDEPVRPIDPSAWVAHTEAVRHEAVLQQQQAAVVPGGLVVPGLASYGLMPGSSFASLESSPVSSSHEPTGTN